MGTQGVLDTAGSRMEVVALPPDAGPDTELTLHIEPSLAAGMVDSLGYLEMTPYQSSEQIVSRFLPNLLTYRALNQLEIPNAASLEEKVATMVSDGLDRLYARQRADGGWGWWNNRSDVQVTAYVTLGLLEARDAGYTVRSDALQRAVDYLVEALSAVAQDEKQSWRRSDALAFYVLSLAERPWPDNVAGSLYASRANLGATGQAYIALALGTVDPADRRVTTLLTDLRDAALETATGVQWEDREASTWSTDVRATAVAVEALVRLAPDDPLIPRAVRWLMLARRGDRWTTTQETVWALIALTDYLVRSGELEGAYEWSVAFNGLDVRTDEVTPDTLLDVTEITRELTGDPAEGLVRERTNAFEVQRDAGPGRLYYTGHLSLFRPVTELEAEQRGVTVQRTYCAYSGVDDVEAATCTPLTSAAPGDLVEVQLTVIVPETRHFVALDAPYPAGLEPVDPTLRTERQDVPEPESESAVQQSTWWYQAAFDHHELRDERAVFFAQVLTPGTYKVRYLLRATLPGQYRVLPATIQEVYFPEVWGRTAGTVFEVEQ
jgi:hypothetical protein